MWTVAAALTHALAGWACLLAVRSVRRRPLGLDAVLAFAVFICGEALIAHGLSAVHAVGRSGLFAANLALFGLVGWLGWSRRPPGRRWPPIPTRLHPASLAVGLLGAMILVSALAYRPNNWDSMTYHLARVAHWLQRGSVGRIPGAEARQVLYPPGAEYLLLGLQGMAGSDRLAGLVQWVAWAATATAAAPMARLFGAPRWLAPFAAVAVAAGPLAVQEASSTQNDLVAGVATVALIASAVPLLHRRGGWRSGDVALLIVVAAAGFIVKPTSLVVAVPLLASGLLVSLRHLAGHGGWRRIGLALPAAALAAGVVVPFQLQRMHAAETRAVTAPYVYLGSGDVLDRAANVVRGLLRNLPLPVTAVDVLAPAQTQGCERPRSLCLEKNRELTEDFTGSVGQAALLLLCLAVGLVRARRLPGRARLALASLAVGWCLFHLVFRDNVWFPRLQLAFFAAVPLALGAFAGCSSRPRAHLLVAAVLGGLLVAHAGVAAVRTPRRPLMLRALRTAGGVSSYYREGPAGIAEEQQAVLDWLTRSGCRRLGLYLGGDSYDYPVTWRAMLQGVEVRHLEGPSDWPCAVYARLTPPSDWRLEPIDGAFLWIPLEPAGER